MIVAYKITLAGKVPHNLDIYFDEENICSLTVNEQSRYEFRHENGVLKVTWIVNDALLMKGIVPGILGITPIPENAHADFIKAKGALGLRQVKEEEMLIQPKTHNRCCNIDGQQYCVDHGCAHAPCGPICA